MITVWGRRSSVNVQKVLWTLAELEIPFTQESVGGSFGGNRDADYLLMNPNGLVPVIRDGDVTMFESNAIVRYLAARFGEGSLRPSDHRALALAEQWMEWQQSTFAPAVGAIFFNKVRLPAEKRANREWHYVLLSEATFYEWRDKNARMAEMLDFARLRG